MISSLEGIGRLGFLSSQSALIPTSRKVHRYKPVLPTHIARRPSLLPDLGSERVDLLDDHFLHPINRVFFFESEVEFLRMISGSMAFQFG